MTDLATDFADLYIEVRREAGDFAVNLRYTGPDSATDVHPLPKGGAPVALNLVALLALTANPDAYGQELGRQFFASSTLKTGFKEAWAIADSQERTLHVRLQIDAGAAELDAVHWETLALPDGGTLATHQRLLFSRYQPSPSWLPVRPPPTRDALRALVVVSSPTDLATYHGNLTALDYAAEAGAVRAMLGAMPCITLAATGQATLDRIVAELEKGVDILYLIAHGALDKGAPMLWLEKPGGTADVIAGGELVRRLGELPNRPRLVVLASCQSAGAGQYADGGAARVALGPQLARAGVPAVLAMQGDISVETNGRFMPLFFRELARHGQIRRTMPVARG